MKYRDLFKLIVLISFTFFVFTILIFGSFAFWELLLHNHDLIIILSIITFAFCFLCYLKMIDEYVLQVW